MIRMRRLRIVFCAAFVALAVLPGASLVRAGTTFPWQNVASESYFHLDVEEGVIDARVDVVVQPGSAEIDEVWLWLMPGATEIEVRQGETVLVFEEQISGYDEDGPKLIAATLVKPLKGKLTTNLELTYTVPAQSAAAIRIEPGAIEAAMVSQGAGSFVLIDVPQHGENVMDPGCLLASSQPEAVRDIGYERWVCGEALLIALSTDDSETLGKCAAMNDRCRQRLVDTPFSAYAQSVTDPSLQRTLHAPITLASREMDVELRYFREDGDWAARQFELAQQALPRLEALFGFDYPFDDVLLRQSHHIEWIGAAGIAFDGQMLLAEGTGVDDEVTIHELAHQWAGLNLETKWLWEGLAEWATQVVAPGLGVATRDWGWQATGHTDPLATWYNGSAVFDSYYWYGKAAAFWHEYEAAVGGRENMTAILAMMDDDPAELPITDRWFLDRGEAVSGANLDAIFLEWVWYEDYASIQLADRRAAHDIVKGLESRAAAAGLTGIPVDIQASLDSWSFKSVEDRVARADRLITDYLDLMASAAGLGLAQTTLLAETWSITTLAQAEQLLQQVRIAVETIRAASSTLADEPAESPGVALLAESRSAYAEGDLESATSLASDAVAAVYNEVASVRMIIVAEATQERYSENFLKRIGLLFEDPAADLEAARQAAAAGESSEAVALASSAYEAWDGAQARGLQRLAIVAGLLSAVTFGSWYLLGRVDRGRKEEVTVARVRDAVPGAPAAAPRSNWRDWENRS